MGVYDPLKKYLTSSSQNVVRLTFPDIEKLLDHVLPKSAYTYSAWWSNGGHTQAYAWINAGYKVTDVDFTAKTVVFSKNDGDAKKQCQQQSSKKYVQQKSLNPFSTSSCVAKTLDVCGYTFTYIQDIIPECDSNGNVKKYYPQNEYDNKSGLPLLYHGKGAFCRFSIEADNLPGVYLWVIDGQIIYIGETAGLKQRFNTGYGYILPRNCYAGGQSTNCKMNKVVLGNFERGKVINLYFYQTTDYKRVELELLNKIYTPYNVKDN